MGLREGAPDGGGMGWEGVVHSTNGLYFPFIFPYSHAFPYITVLRDLWALPVIEAYYVYVPHSRSMLSTPGMAGCLEAKIYFYSIYHCSIE